MAGMGVAPDVGQQFVPMIGTKRDHFSLETGMVLQLHPGSHRNHAPAVMAKHCRDKGFDIPTLAISVSRDA